MKFYRCQEGKGDCYVPDVDQATFTARRQQRVKERKKIRVAQCREREEGNAETKKCSEASRKLRATECTTQQANTEFSFISAPCPIPTNTSPVEEDVNCFNSSFRGSEGVSPGLPNVGNICYLNAGLQISARLYPDLWEGSECHENTTSPCVQTVLSKLIHGEEVTRPEAEACRDTFIQAYNAGKPEEERLRVMQQEDPRSRL